MSGPGVTGETLESAYQDPDAWAERAAIVYRPLAQLLVQRCSPVAFEPGMRVLDVGAGTGLVAEALGHESRLHIVGVDRSALMLAYHRGSRPPGVRADAARLPFRCASFDVWVASFLLNHLAPEPALQEAARVLRPGGAVLASTWPAVQPDPVKSAIDEVAHRSGWVPPSWYGEMKREFDAVSGDPERLAALARRAGLANVEVRAVSTPVHGPASAIADYRLALPQYGPWRAAVPPATLATVRRLAAAALEPILNGGGWTLEMVVLTARS